MGHKVATSQSYQDFSAGNVDRNIATASGAFLGPIWVCDSTFWKMEEARPAICQGIISFWVIQFSQQKAC